MSPWVQLLTSRMEVLGLTGAAQLAVLVNASGGSITRQTAWDWLQEDGSPPSPENLERLAVALGLPWTDPVLQMAWLERIQQKRSGRASATSDAA